MKERRKERNRQTNKQTNKQKSKQTNKNNNKRPEYYNVMHAIDRWKDRGVCTKVIAMEHYIYTWVMAIEQYVKSWQTKRNIISGKKCHDDKGKQKEQN